MKLEECCGATNVPRTRATSLRGRIASRGSVGRGHLRCEGELLREGPLDEGLRRY